MKPFMVFAFLAEAFFSLSPSHAMPWENRGVRSLEGAQCHPIYRKADLGFGLFSLNLTTCGKASLDLVGVPVIKYGKKEEPNVEVAGTSLQRFSTIQR